MFLLDTMTGKVKIYSRVYRTDGTGTAQPEAVGWYDVENK